MRVPNGEQIGYLIQTDCRPHAVWRACSQRLSECDDIGLSQACDDRQACISCGTALFLKPSFERLNVRATHDARDFARSNAVLKCNAH